MLRYKHLFKLISMVMVIAIIFPLLSDSTNIIIDIIYWSGPKSSYIITTKNEKEYSFLKTKLKYQTDDTVTTKLQQRNTLSADLTENMMKFLKKSKNVNIIEEDVQIKASDNHKEIATSKKVRKMFLKK